MKSPDQFERLLRGPIVPTLARLSAPNIVVAAAMTLTTFADAWFVGRLGITALASLALVFPIQTLMQMMSAGAMGGGVSSAVARALGSGRPERATAIALHAMIIALAMAALYIVVAAVFAPWFFGLLGGSGTVLDGAVAYAQIAFGGAGAIWLTNTFASVLRGTGNMAVPARILIAASLLHVALSGALTLGWGPFPALGVRGPATALVASFGVAALVMGGAVVAGRGGVRLRLAGIALQAELFRDILKVGGVACGNALLTIATIVIVTRLIAEQGTAALAGYGLGSRLELMLIPISFGIGGALTATVGANFGARQFARARRVAWTGGLFVAAASGLIGGVAAVWPDLWLANFTTDAEARAIGARYLAIVGPFYLFFGLGQTLYFASQGTGNMIWPFSAGVVRLAVAAGGGAIAATYFAADTTPLFACLSAGLVCFGGLIAGSLFSRVWNPRGS
ncbi:MAG: MATE family efflux transporter [Alphaproteobacteria bacterium]|nr:MATE family efflux transporter [Alphaproteobacteria bacterium]